MVTAIFDFAASQISLRVNNGTPVTVSFAGPIYHSAATLTSLAFAGIYSNARVDEVGLWQRVLTDPEIAALYAGGSGLTYPF